MIPKMESVMEVNQFLASSLHSSLDEVHLSPIAGDCISHPLQSTHDDHPQALRKSRISLAAQLQQARPFASAHRTFLILFSNKIMTGYYPVDGWLSKLTQLLAKELPAIRSTFPTLLQDATNLDRSANFNQCRSYQCDKPRHRCNYFQDLDSHIVSLFHHNETISVKINRETETIRCLQLHIHIRRCSNFDMQPLCPSQIEEIRHYLIPKLIHTDCKPENNEDPRNITHFAFLLLLLAGDVEVNPGPGK